MPIISHDSFPPGEAKWQLQKPVPFNILFSSIHSERRPPFRHHPPLTLQKETTTIAQGKFSKPRQTNRPSGDDRSNTHQDLDQFIDSVNHLCADDRLKEPAAPAKKAPVKRKSPLLPLLLFLVLLLAAGGFLLLSPGKKIAQGVSVSGLSLDGLRKKAATQAVDAAFSPRGHDIVLSCGQDISLTQSETGLTLDTRALVTDALALEAPAQLSLAPYLHWDEASVRRSLERLNQQLGESHLETSFRLEGEMPNLSENVYQPGDALPTLAVTLGVPSSSLDMDGAQEAIFASVSQGQFTVDLTPFITPLSPLSVSAADILEQVSVAPVDARVDAATGNVTPGSYGISCDEAALEALLTKAQPGQTVRIAMEAAAPRILGEEVYFQDVLGFCQTPHNDNEKRNTNLTLACKALNGVVLQPGQTLSYNETLGQRTEAAGYQKAPAYSGTELVDSLGGGICQVSSTLYLCSLYAEMDIVDRVSHGYPANYMPVGLDATVSWGSPDLKISNPYSTPVKIVAESTADFVRVWIMGTETRDYTVRMAFGSSSDGYARSYYCRYKDGQLIEKTDAALSGYLSINVPTRGEIGSDEIYRNGNIRQEPIGQPSEETLEAAKTTRPPQYRH